MSQNEALELQELRLKFKSMMEGETKNSQDVIKKEYKIINHVTQKSIKVNKSQSELERLYIERENLLNSGQYTERDPLIVKLDNMIKSLEI
jgi:hypothetical protein